MTKSTLGRGLGSLIPAKTEGGMPIAGTGERIQQVAVNDIQPNTHQPRQHIDRDSLEELISSIKEHGIIQPLVAVATRTGYQLIAGERRFRAAQFLGLKRVPVVVRSVTEQQKLELALVENVQRVNLNPLEKANGYQRLIDEFVMTQEAVAQKVGQSRAAVANALRLLALPEDIKQALAEGAISEGHAKVLLSVPKDDERQRLFKEILKNSLSVRSAEAQARKATGRRASSRRQPGRDVNVQEKEGLLREVFGTKVEINKRGSAGSVTIHFYSDEEYQSLVRKLLQ